MPDRRSSVVVEVEVVVEEGDDMMDVIAYTDDDGATVEYGVLAYRERADVKYVIVAPAEELEADEDGDISIYVFRYDEVEGGGMNLEPVDDDEIIAELIDGLERDGILTGPTDT